LITSGNGGKSSGGGPWAKAVDPRAAKTAAKSSDKYSFIGDDFQ
jgi:recombinational DNA repair protein RecT